MMTLAEQKHRQNVAEYLLFIWQMEDLLRAVHFEPEALSDFIRGYTPNEEAFEEERLWFIQLIRKMRSERVETKGHISEVHELIFELNYLHSTMLNVIKDKTYIDLYRTAQPNIEEYLKHSDGKSTNDVETCLTALYGILLLRLKKEPISDETESSIRTFSQLLARLAHHYRLMKEGEMNLSKN